MYSNGVRLRKSRYPDFDPTAGGFLCINTSRWLGAGSGGKFIVGVEASTLPAAVLDPGWGGGVLNIFPTRSWINIVNVTFKPVPSPALAVAGLRHFVVQCPPTLPFGAGAAGGPLNRTPLSNR